MTDPVDKNEGAENEKSKLEDSTAVDMELDESKAHLINANGGAGGDHDKYKTAIIDPGAASSDGEVSFNGLGKDEVMQYANDPFWVRLRWILFILFWVGWFAMLATAIAIIVVAPRCPPRADLKWYNSERIYQIFPKSFKDSDGDGVGDFTGLDEKKDYLDEKLGIKAMWISSMFKTDGTEDSGLAITDHKDIEDYFGTTVDEFRSWMKKLLKDGKRIILDLIPNNTGKEHPWFKKSQAREKGYENFYIWSATVPNNWRTADDKGAWTMDPVRNEYYFSQFGENLPDLNLREPKVVEEIKDIMKFWLDAGVSGFNIRDVEYLMENEDLSVDNVEKENTVHHPDTFTFLEELREVADSFSDKPGRERLLVATVYSADHNQTMNYWGTRENKRLHVVAPIMSDFKKDCDAVCIKELIEETISDEERQWVGLQLGNEHTSRITSRVDTGDDMYKQKVMAAQAIQLLLPGTPITYYGDEFGQRDSDGTPSAEAGRDARNAYRGPMQWNKQTNAGFTDSDKGPWYPVSSNYREDNVQAGLVHFADMTPLDNYKKLSDLRENESFQWGKTKICAINKDLLMFSRKAHRFPYFVTVINLSNNPMNLSPADFSCVPSKDEGIVRFHARDKKIDQTIDIKEIGIQLMGHDTIVLEFTADE